MKYSAYKLNPMLKVLMVVNSLIQMTHLIEDRSDPVNRLTRTDLNIYQITILHNKLMYIKSILSDFMNPKRDRQCDTV